MWWICQDILAVRFIIFIWCWFLCTGSLGGWRKRGNRGNENENFRSYTQSLFRICETPLSYRSLSPLLYRCLSGSLLQLQLCKLICPASRMGCSKTSSVVDTFWLFFSLFLIWFVRRISRWLETEAKSRKKLKNRYKRGNHSALNQQSLSPLLTRDPAMVFVARYTSFVS